MSTTTAARSTDPLNSQGNIIATRKEVLATYYAWGRLDQGHPAIVSESPTSEPSVTLTAHTFGKLYRDMHVKVSLGEESHAFSVTSAWDLFVLSNGASVTPEPRRRKST